MFSAESKQGGWRGGSAGGKEHPILEAAVQLPAPMLSRLQLLLTPAPGRYDDSDLYGHCTQCVHAFPQTHGYTTWLHNNKS